MFQTRAMNVSEDCVNNIFQIIFQLNIMEQARATTRPQTSGAIFSAFGTFFILTLSFQLASIQPVHAGGVF